MFFLSCTKKEKEPRLLHYYIFDAQNISPRIARFRTQQTRGINSKERQERIQRRVRSFTRWREREREAFAIYDTIQYVKPPVHTIAIGTAWGEAAMLLSAGKKVKVEGIYQLFIYAIFTGAQSRTSIC